MRILVTSVLFLLLALTVSYASPTQISTSLFPQNARVQTPPAVPRIHQHDPDRPSTAAPSPRKRITSLTDMGSGWVAYVQTFDSFIPAQLAAAALTEFYISAFNHVQSFRTRHIPGNYYGCEMDNLRLEFFGADDAVPWDFITWFMGMMLDRVSRGFTGKFDCYYIHVPTTRGVRVSLEVINVAAAA